MFDCFCGNDGEINYPAITHNFTELCVFMCTILDREQ